MLGLLLTNYYLVYRSFFAYTGLAILVSGLILYFGDTSMYRITAMLIILLMSMPALEVIKYEGKTGYDKYVLTLPVTRKNIVQSHYFFYLLVVFIGSLLSYGFFYVYGLITDITIDGIFNIVSFGIYIVLFAGSIVYPLLYIFGSEKSDAIVIGGGIGGLFSTFALQSLVGNILEKLPTYNQQIDSSFYVSIIYIIFGILIYFLSFFIAVIIYQKKDF
ncbi:ABC-2 transporter permease [Niallia sp. FSL R7-0271]|uniref:ABC-2 transporter permease n=1 Tax=Niallia sp. FSL R7-0271 TaxID=2921678 RepID=UPI0030FCBF1A